MCIKQLQLIISEKEYQIIINNKGGFKFLANSKWLKSRILQSDGYLKCYTSVKFNLGLSPFRAYIIVKFITIAGVKTELMTLSKQMTVNRFDDDSLKLYYGSILEYKTLSGLVVTTSLSRSYDHAGNEVSQA